MKKCKCKGGCKLGKLFGKLIGIALLANVALFVVFFFDLDGKLLFNVVEPFLKKHVLKTPYEMDKFPKYEY